MSETLAVDYAFSRPAPSTIKAHGYKAAGRYLGGSASKQLTRSEANALHKAGLGIWLVYESTANRATQGKAAGVADAHAALKAADTLGYPKACPLFFAVDFDANPSAVSAYFEGVRSVLGDRAGIYGGIRVIEADLAPWRWQTVAWSGGKLAPSAHLYQRLHMTHPVTGCDENVVCRPIPVWGPRGVLELAPPGAAPKKAAPSKPAPKKGVQPGTAHADAQEIIKDAQHARSKVHTGSARDNVLKRIAHMAKGLFR